MSISNALLRAAAPAARAAAQLMGSDDNSGVTRGTFTMAGFTNQVTGRADFTGVFNSADEATKMLYAGYQENVSLICVAMSEQFASQPANRSNLVFEGVTYRAREVKGDGLHYTFVLFRPA